MRAHAHPHLHLGHNSVTLYPIERRTVEASPSTANSVRRTLVVLTGRISGDVRFTRCAHRVPKGKKQSDRCGDFYRFGEPSLVLVLR